MFNKTKGQLEKLEAEVVALRESLHALAEALTFLPKLYQPQTGTLHSPEYQKFVELTQLALTKSSHQQQKEGSLL